MKFVRYGPGHEEAYATFLRRISADPRTTALPFGYYGASPDIAISRWLMLGDGVVVGAANVKVQDYEIRGRRHQIANVSYPVSLGIADARYVMVGPLLFRRLDQMFPLNFLLGMGRPDESPALKLCQLLGWSAKPLSYLYLPLRLAPLAAMRLAERPLAAAAVRALGAGGLLPADLLLRRRAGAGGAGEIEIAEVGAFDARLDAFWAERRRELGFSLVRDSRQLNALAPPSVAEFHRLLITIAGRCVGYAVVLTPEAGVARFAGARVGTLAEFNALDSEVERAAAAVSRHLVRQRLDGVIFNGSHAATLEALARRGFRERATNFYLAASKGLQAVLDAQDVRLGDALLSRLDGDGPIGLGVDLD